MMRLPLFALPLLAAACGAESPPVQSAAATAPLFRGGAAEVRLRCGSETLRARLRGGQLLAEVGGGESKVLLPVTDPRARSGDAYSDGKLTLYKVPETQSWAFANGDSAAAECKPAP